MKEKVKFAFLSCLLAVLLAGCGQAGVPEVVETTTISVNKKGEVAYYLVGEFDKDYYKLSELSAMASDEAAEFSGNDSENPKVTVSRVETLQNDATRVLIVYQFDSCLSFSEFNEGNFFYGTVGEADGKGLMDGAVLKSVKDGSVTTEEQIRQEGAKKLIVTDEKAAIYCPAKVTCLSEGAVLNEDGSVDTTAAETTVYILME